MKALGKNVWIGIIGNLFLALSVSATSENQPDEARGNPWLQLAPDVASQLFQRPSPDVIASNSVSSESPEVAFPMRQCDAWLRKVLAVEWLPDKKLEPLLLRNEVDGRDVVRYSWSKNAYRIEVSQTASIFAMRLFPEGGQGTGTNAADRLRVAKELCLQVFPKQGSRWDSHGNVVAVSNLAEKIASYSFRSDTVLSLKGSDRVSGRPRTMKEAGVHKPQDERHARMENDSNNPNWDLTERAWRYWFHMVNWWNDGKSVGVYFLKAEEGSWIPNYLGSLDRNWFRLPRDRTGRTLPQN